MPKPISLPARAATADEAYDEDEDYEGEDEPNMKFIHALFVVLILHVIAVGGIFAFNSMKAKQTAKNALKTPIPAETAKTEAAAPVATPTTAKPANPSLAGWKGKTHEVVAGDTLARIAATYKISAEVIGKENNITTYSMLRVGQVLKIPAADKPTTKPTETAKHPTDTAAKQAFLATKSETTATASPKAAPESDSLPPASSESKVATTAPEAADAGVYVVAKGENPYSIAKKLHVSYSQLLTVNGIKDPTKIQIGQKLKIPEKKN
ncbi:hypothetical protein BH09VER1_BH09VER1_32570 [soil metagenome]